MREDLLGQQQALLAQQLRVLARLQDGLNWSFAHLPENTASAADPATSERIAAIVDRFTKMQDQFAGALGHAHNMLGEKRRSFHDVIIWAVKQEILPDVSTWLTLRSLRNRLTHEYELDDNQLPELLSLIRQSVETLDAAISQFKSDCQTMGLLPRNGDLPRPSQ